MDRHHLDTVQKLLRAAELAKRFLGDMTYEYPFAAAAHDKLADAMDAAQAMVDAEEQMFAEMDEYFTRLAQAEAAAEAAAAAEQSQDALVGATP